MNNSRNSSSENIALIKITIDDPRGDRLDMVLAQAHQQQYGGRALSRSQLQRYIDAGEVSWNGKVILRPGVRLEGRGELSFPALPEPQSLIAESAEDIPIIYEDEAILVIAKPAGIAVHPGAGRNSGTLVNKLLLKLAPTNAQAGEEAAVRPGVVHRLDKDTSGVLVLAKTVQAHAHLAKQFAKHSIDRQYEALVLSTPRGRRAFALTEEGTVDAPLTKRGKLVVVATSPQEHARARRAITHWRVIEQLGYGAIMNFTLETGRTHQIRVHASSVQSPIIGDQTYGDFTALPAALQKLHRDFGRQALHARLLGIEHPESGKRMQFEVDPPADHLSLIQQFRAFGVGKTS